MSVKIELLDNTVVIVGSKELQERWLKYTFMKEKIFSWKFIKA